MWPNIPQLKLWNIWEYSPIFNIKKDTTNTIVNENMLGYLPLDIILNITEKTVCFSEQIMSVDKYPSMFLCQMEAIAYMLYKSWCI